MARLCAQWRDGGAIALDTEFERTRTFFPRPALLQVRASEKNWLLDPLTITDFAPLGELLSAAETTKVIHSASEDLELLQRLTGCLPQSLFDTQIAAGLLGYGFSLGYRRMVEEFCGISLSKQETRSNWLRRPLRDGQLQYAAYDVHFLPSIQTRLHEELDQKNRLHWLHEECQALVSKQNDSADYENAYRRISYAWKLEPLQLATLRALSAWREHEIRRRDIPRAHLFKDEVLVELARAQPKNAADLQQVEGVSAKELARSGTTLLRIVAKVSELGAEQLPTALPAPLSSKQFDPVVKKLKAVVLRTAEELNVAPELLGHRRALEKLVRHSLVDGLPGVSPFFAGWRELAVGEQLLEAMRD